eukprot:CAMPEP_0168469822 /NCGR_PEP_ID=MMETSP0228-20121227/58415_1 /TAXON_ID=133427 /ORGANISM="Protoceratium reticulatum, Strain CCCM 535 (=CCMP 1889)" /LENGTH=54 /DNA_ID=CAMNT_0008485613 /DNA_START=227 /DNA_END=388 /DNA_ORIENTATION=+
MTSPPAPSASSGTLWRQPAAAWARPPPRPPAVQLGRSSQTPRLGGDRGQHQAPP